MRAIIMEGAAWTITTTRMPTLCPYTFLFLLSDKYSRLVLRTTLTPYLNT